MSIISLVISASKWSTFLGATVQHVMLACTFLAFARFEIFHIKFDAAEFDRVASIQFIILKYK